MERTDDVSTTRAATMEVVEVDDGKEKKDVNASPDVGVDDDDDDEVR